jgi:hypothetical protein
MRNSKFCCSFSQMRGTPRKKLGAISRMLVATVSIDSAKFTQPPVIRCSTVE